MPPGPVLPSIIALKTAKSTNDEIFLRIAAGETLAVWTTHQTHGRGSRGRQWVSPAGHSLALSLGLAVPGLKPPGQFHYPLFAGLVVHHVLTGFGVIGLKLKWPNDILLNGKKLAGILCESKWSANLLQIVIGIGINLKYHHQLANLPNGATALDTNGVALSGQVLSEAIVREFWHSWDRYQNGTSLISEWLTQSWIKPGCAISITQSDRHLTGNFEGLSPLGNLCVRKNDGQIEDLPVSAGSLSITPITCPPDQAQARQS